MLAYYMPSFTLHAYPRARQVKHQVQVLFVGGGIPDRIDNCGTVAKSSDIGALCHVYAFRVRVMVRTKIGL